MSVQANTNTTFSLLSWNVMGHSPIRVQFDKVIPKLREYDADIFCLQEGPDTQEEYKKLLEVRDHTVLTSDKLFSPEGGWHMNYISTVLPVRDSGDLRLHFPQSRGADTKETNGYAMWVDVCVGIQIVRVYNCHLRIRGVGIADRLFAIGQVFDHATTHQGPVVICGDMNTTLPASRLSRMIIGKFHDLPHDAAIVDGVTYAEDERIIFSTQAKQAEYVPVFDLHDNTWALPPTSIELFSIKLDWMLLKHLVVIEKNMGTYITDHRPLFAQLSLQ